MASSLYYVTLCIKRDSGTKAIPWYNNAKFNTRSSAENYKASLLPLLEQMNSHRAVNIEGQCVLVITDNPAPHVNYSDETEIQAKPENNLKSNRDIRKSEENNMPPKRSEKQQERSKKIFFAIIAVMLATALYNYRHSLEFLGVAVLLVGLIALLIGYARATKKVLDDVGIVNPLTVSLAVIVLIGLIAELLK